MASHLSTNTASIRPEPDISEPSLWANEQRCQAAEARPLDGLRPHLLYQRYGIVENPFGVTPNPRYLYQSKTHAEARSSLIMGIECGVGFQALIAPPGMGKTTLLFSLLELFRDVARTAFLFQIHGDSRDLLRYLAAELGGNPNSSDVVRMQEVINQLLIRERRAGRRTLIIIDEAQSLDVAVLETVRLLSNFESPTSKLAHIILAGQPQLANKLAKPGLAQLVQRISIRATLTPFDLDDTTKYINHRLRVACYRGPVLFTPPAVEFIWKHSHGIPREINTLCFNALLLAGAVGQKQIDADTLREVVEDLRLDRIPAGANSPVNDTRGEENVGGGDLSLELRSALTAITNICEVLSRSPRIASADTTAARVASARPGFTGVVPHGVDMRREVCRDESSDQTASSSEVPPSEKKTAT